MQILTIAARKSHMTFKKITFIRKNITIKSEIQVLVTTLYIQKSCESQVTHAIYMDWEKFRKISSENQKFRQKELQYAQFI